MDTARGLGGREGGREEREALSRRAFESAKGSRHPALGCATKSFKVHRTREFFFSRR